MACFSVECGTMVYAVFNLISVVLSTLASLGLLAYWIIYYTTNINDFRYELDNRNIYLFLYVILGHLAISIIFLVFGSLLMDGILKKKANYLKAYVVFGSFLMVVMGFVVIGVYTGTGEHFGIDDFCAILILFSLYGGILWMIASTYKKFDKTADQFGHIPLVEDRGNA